MHPVNFTTIGPLIQSICNISGIPGIAYGVLHKNEVIHTGSFGFADVENRVPIDTDTTFFIGSLSNAFTSAILSSLIHDGKLSSWDTPLRTILPEFNRADEYGNATIADLLSHRTGVAPLDSLWLASNNDPFLSRSQALSVFNSSLASHSFRTGLNYNYFGYEILGQVIERLTGATFSENLYKRLLAPLGLSRTYYFGYSAENEALPYAALRNASIVRISPPPLRDDILMGPGWGIRSSLNDLLRLYSAYNYALSKEELIVKGETPDTDYDNPLKDVMTLLRGHVLVPSTTVRERSYALGWVRSELPAILGLYSNRAPVQPVVGAGSKSRLALHHSGLLPGFGSYGAIFPETGSGVVVLTNSLALSDGSRWVAELLIEAVFDNLKNMNDYEKVARRQAEVRLEKYDEIQQKVFGGRSATQPIVPLKSYAGRYWNRLHNFFIDITYADESNTLHISFMGRAADTFALGPHQINGFYWGLTHDESAMLGRLTGHFCEDYFIVKFEFGNTESEVTGLRWRHDQELPVEGELFTKEQTRN